jgi:hypothetical protein
MVPNNTDLKPMTETASIRAVARKLIDDGPEHLELAKRIPG